MTERPYAALLRENELLRSVAMKAIRLRRIGMNCETAAEAYDELCRDNSVMTKSMTQQMMLDQAFKTAMDAFDLSVLGAADAGMDWAKEHGIPRPVLAHER